MTLSTRWLDDSKSELLTVFEGGWTWEEFHHCLDESQAMFQTGGSSISVVIDFSRSTGLPSGAPFAHARRAFNLYASQPNYSGIVAVITTRPFTVILARMMIASGMARGLMIAGTRDEALNLIRARKAKRLHEGQLRD